MAGNNTGAVRFVWRPEVALNRLRLVDRHMAAAMRAAVSEARRLEQPHIRTGRLYRSIQWRSRLVGGRRQYRFLATAPYARYVNTGHYLRNGRWQEGRHFMEAGWMAAMRKLRELQSAGRKRR